MRIAQIQNNTVINIIEAESVWSSNGSDTFIASDEAGIGWELINGVLIAPPPEVVMSPTPVKFIEDHIVKYYTPMQQTMMKIWWDALPHESTPKLSSIYAWLMELTILAASEQFNNFSAPPFSIDEVYTECTNIIKSSHPTLSS